MIKLVQRILMFLTFSLSADAFHSTCDETMAQFYSSTRTGLAYQLFEGQSKIYLKVCDILLDLTTSKTNVLR